MDKNAQEREGNVTRAIVLLYSYLIAPFIRECGNGASMTRIHKKARKKQYEMRGMQYECATFR